MAIDECNARNSQVTLTIEQGELQLIDDNDDGQVDHIFLAGQDAANGRSVFSEVTFDSTEAQAAKQKYGIVDFCSVKLGNRFEDFVTHINKAQELLRSLPSCAGIKDAEDELVAASEFELVGVDIQRVYSRF